MKQRRYRWSFALLLPLLLCTASLTLVQLFVNSGRFQEELQAELARLMDGRVIEFRMLEVHPDLTVVVHDVTIRHPKTRRTLIAARLATGRLTSQPRDLARGRVRFSSLYAADASVLIEIGEDGRPSILDALGVSSDPDEPGSGVTVELADVVVVRAQARIERAGVEIEVRDVAVSDFSMSIADEIEMRGRVQTPGGRLRVAATEGHPLVEIDWGDTEIEGFRWRGMSFSVTRACVGLPGGSPGTPALVDVAGSLQIEPELVFTVEGSVRGDGRMPALAQFTEALQGQLEVRGRFEGPMFEPRGSFRATAAGVEVPGVPLHDLAAIGTLVDGTFSFEDLALRLLDGSARVSGDFAPLRAEYDLKAAVEGLDVAGPFRRWPEAVAWAGGRVSGSVALKGRGFPPEVNAEAELDLRLRRAGGRTPIAVPPEIAARGRIGLQPSRVSVRRLAVTAGPHRASAHGHVDPPTSRLDLELDVRTGPLASVLGPLIPASLALDGSLAFSGRVSGASSNPTVSGSVSGTGVRALGLFSGEEVRAELHLADGMARLAGLQARTRLGSLSLDAQARLWTGDVGRPLSDPPFEVTRAEVRDVPLRALLPDGVELEGRGHADLRLWGTVRAPRGEARAWTDGIDLYGERVQQASADVALLDGAVELTGLEVSLAGGGGVKAQGRLDWNGAVSGHVVARSFPLSSVNNLARSGLSPAGLVTLDLAASGSLGDPGVQGLVQVRGLELAGRPLGDAHLIVTSRERTVHVRGERVLGPFSLDATVPLFDGSPSARVAFSDVKLEELVPEVAALGLKATVSGGGEASLAGSPSASTGSRCPTRGSTRPTARRGARSRPGPLPGTGRALTSSTRTWWRGRAG